MTEFLVSQNVSSVPQLVAEGHEINLCDALEWLFMGSESEDALSEPERQSRKERRLELLLWIMNLERRLSAYVEPA